MLTVHTDGDPNYELPGTVSVGHLPALDGEWHQVAYTLQDGIWEAYLDGSLSEWGHFLMGDGLLTTHGAPLYVVGGSQPRAAVGYYTRRLFPGEVATLHAGVLGSRRQIATNWLLNGGMESSINGWGTIGNMSAINTYAQARFGSRSMFIRKNDAISDSFVTSGNYEPLPVVGEVTYTFSAWVYPTTVTQINIMVAPVGLPESDHLVTGLIPNQWQRVFRTYTTAATTNECTFCFGWRAAEAPAQTICYIDGASLVVGDSPDFFDGDTPNSDDFLYSWTGGSGGSPSIRTSVSTTYTHEPTTTSARFNLGVYALTSPESPRGEDPVTYEVDGYDLLYLLSRTGPGDTYVVNAGTGYLAAAQAAITAAGISAPVQFDGTLAATTLPTAMVWVLTEQADSWLRIINDLLAAINYRGLWADEDGRLRSGPYAAPETRAVEWVFDTANLRTNLVGEERTMSADVWGIPNVWRFVRRGMTVQPVEGAGSTR